MMKNIAAKRLMVAVLLVVSTTINAPFVWAEGAIEGAVDTKQDEVLLNLVSNMIDQNKPDLIDSQEIPSQQKQAGKLIYKCVQDKQPLTAEAVKQLDELCPNRPMMWYLLGMLFVMKGSQPSAIKALEQSLKLNPDFVLASRTLQQLSPDSHTNGAAPANGALVGEKRPDGRMHDGSALDRMLSGDQSAHVGIIGQSNDYPADYQPLNLNAFAEQEKLNSDDRIETALCSVVRGDEYVKQNENDVLAKDKSKYLVLKGLVTKTWGQAGIVEARKVLKDDDWLLWTVLGDLAFQRKDLGAAEEYYMAAFHVSKASAPKVSKCLRAEGKIKEADNFDRQNKPEYGYPPD